MAAPAEGLEPPTTGLRTPRLYPLSYAGTATPRRGLHCKFTRLQPSFPAGATLPFPSQVPLNSAT